MALTALLSMVALFQASPGSVTADLKLLGTSKVPVAAKIQPYRNALVAQEYLVVKVVKGALPGVKPNEKIRIFRWGLLDAKPTAVAKAKKGDNVRLAFAPLEGWTQMEREFQVDELPGNLAISYYVEVGTSKK